MTDIYKTFKPTTETHFPLKCTQTNLQDRVYILKTENMPGFYLHHSGTELESNKQKKNSQKMKLVLLMPHCVRGEITEETRNT